MKGSLMLGRHNGPRTWLLTIMTLPQTNTKAIPQAIIMVT